MNFQNFLFLINFLIFLFPTFSQAADPKEVLKALEKEDFYGAEKILKELANGSSPNSFDRIFTLKEAIAEWTKLYQKIPELKNLEQTIQREGILSEKEYKQIYTNTLSKLNEAIQTSQTIDSTFISAIYRTSYDLSILHSKTHFETIRNNIKTRDGDKEQENHEKQEQEGKEDNSPPWNQGSDQYKPRNKPFDSSGSGNNQSILIETNAPLTSPLLKTETFDSINLERWSKIGIGRSNPYQDDVSSKNYSFKVHTFGQNEILLPIPLGYRPISTRSDLQIIEKPLGEFLLRCPSSLPLNIAELQLQKIKLKDNFEEKTTLVQKNTQSTGIQKELWPKELLDVIAMAKEKSSDPLKQVKSISDYIKQNYRYSSSKLDKKELEEANALVEKYKQEGDPVPVAMAKAKICQCDGAAWILSSIARDFLKVPTRVADGRTAVKRGEVIVVRKGDPQHAWVEVWDEKRGWVEFDATPPEAIDKSDKKKKNNSNDLPINPQKDQTQKDQTQNNQTEKDQESMDVDRDNIDNNKTTEESNLENSSKLLEEIEKVSNQKATNVFFLKKYLKERMIFIAAPIGNPKRKIEEIDKFQKELDELKDLTIRFHLFINSLAIKLEKEKERQLSYENLNRETFQQKIKERMDSNDVRSAYQMLQHLYKDLNFLGNFRNLTREEENYKNSLERMINELKKVNHQSAKEFELVDQFWKALPGPISKKYLKEKYGDGVTSLGNRDNLNLAQDLQEMSSANSQLATIIPMTKVAAWTDLLLQKSFKPIQEKLYIGKQTVKRQKRSVIVPMQDILDIPYALMSLKPLDELMSDCVEGKLSTYGYREPVTLTKPAAKNEEIMTLALVDESNSMEGNRTKFAQTIISSFVDKARQESSKKIKHNVIIIPFSDKVGDIEIIENDEQAKKLFQSVVHQNRKIMNQGTNIEAALVHAYDEISKGFNQSKNVKKGNHIDLKKANIWLITDGGSKIDIENLKKARSRVPSDVSINLNIIFIGEKNRELENFLTKDSPDHAKLIKYISDTDVKKLLSQKIDLDENLNRDEAFATFKTQLQLNGELLS